MIGAMFYKYFDATRLMQLVTIALLLAVFAPHLVLHSVAQLQAKPNYEVYALSYGVYPNFPVSGLIAGADKDRKIDLQMMVWLVKGSNGKNILVDTGCYHDNVVKGKGIQNLIKASDTIAKVGLAASDITDVIITTGTTQTAWTCFLTRRFGFRKMSTPTIPAPRGSRAASTAASNPTTC